MDVYLLLINITVYSIIIPLGFVFFKFSTRPSYFRWLGFLLLLSFLFDLSGLIFPTTNIYIGNIYPMLELAIISVIYTTIIFDSRKHTIVIAVVIGLFLFYKIYQNFHYEDINTQSFRFRVFTSFWFLILSAYFFIVLHNRPPVESILQYPLFWFNTAILTYFSGNIFLFTAYTIFTDSPDLNKLYVPIHGFFNIIQNCLFTLALYFNYKEIVNE